MGETGGMIGRTIDDFESSAKTASSFTTNYENTFMPSIAVPLKLELFEGKGSIVRYTFLYLYTNSCEVLTTRLIKVLSSNRVL